MKNLDKLDKNILVFMESFSELIEKNSYELNNFVGVDFSKDMCILLDDKKQHYRFKSIIETIAYEDGYILDCAQRKIYKRMSRDEAEVKIKECRATVKISEIVKVHRHLDIEELNFEGEKIIFRLTGTLMDNLRMTEQEYYSFLDHLELGIVTNDFSIKNSYDVGSYEYFTKERECNYLDFEIIVNNYHEIDNVMANIMAYIQSCKKGTIQRWEK